MFHLGRIMMVPKRAEYLLPNDLLLNINLGDVTQECILLFGYEPFSRRVNYPSMKGYDPKKVISVEGLNETIYSLLLSTSITYQDIYFASLPVNEEIVKHTAVRLWNNFFVDYFDYSPEDAYVDNEFIFEDKDVTDDRVIRDCFGNIITLKFGLEQDEGIFIALFFLKFINYLGNLFPQFFNYILQNPKLGIELIPRDISANSQYGKRNKRIGDPCILVNEEVNNVEMEYDVVCKTILY